MRRRCRGDRNVLTKQRAGLRRRLGGLHEFLGADPVLGVVPWRARQNRVRLGRMRQCGRTYHVRAVEVGVEAHRVIALARQRPNAVMVHRLQRFGDGVRQGGVRADFNERGVLLGGNADRMVQPNRLTHIGNPVVGVQGRRLARVGDGGDERNSRRRGRQIG